MVLYRSARWIWILVTMWQGPDAIATAAHQNESAFAQTNQRAWRLVHVPDPLARRAAIAALEAASSRLSDEQCERILVDFERFTGGRLKERLSALSSISRTIRPWWPSWMGRVIVNV